MKDPYTTGGSTMKRILALAATLALAAPGVALADPDFGPGNSSKGPQDGGSKCLASGHGTGPGATEAVPGCKG
jgi:hypothetical protein